ncbi:MAG: PilZ domain-containing protein [Candidatus Acidiferrales bacterium]
MSRIWDALKQAENERGRGKARQKDAEHAHSDGADRRRSERWGQPVSVLVYGSDSAKQPFHEETETADINDDGCSFTIATAVAKGQRLFLVNMLNDAERECRVVQAGQRARGKAQVAVEFVGSAPDFWLPRKH